MDGPRHAEIDKLRCTRMRTGGCSINWLPSLRSKAELNSHNKRSAVEDEANLPSNKCTEGTLQAHTYLEKSKQNYIEQWLAGNAFEPALSLLSEPKPLCIGNDSNAKCQTDTKRKKQSPGVNTDVKRKKREPVNPRKVARKLFPDKLASVNAKVPPEMVHITRSKTGSAKARRVYGHKKNVGKVQSQTDVKIKQRSPNRRMKMYVNKTKREPAKKVARKLFPDKLASVSAKIRPEIVPNTGSAKARLKTGNRAKKKDGKVKTDVKRIRQRQASGTNTGVNGNKKELVNLRKRARKPDSHADVKIKRQSSTSGAKNNVEGNNKELVNLRRSARKVLPGSQADLTRKRQITTSCTHTDAKRKKRESVNTLKSAKVPSEIFHNTRTKTGSLKARRKILPRGLGRRTESTTSVAMSSGDSSKIIRLSKTKKRKKRKVAAKSSGSLLSTPEVDLPQKSFLASLSKSTPDFVDDPEAQFYKFNFAKKKDELKARLFKLYNREIFNNILDPKMKITWNVKMQGTAAFCYNRRSVRDESETRTTRIELSTRVIDRADRLRDTLLHEMCHAATWITEGVPDGHGPIWKSFTAIARERFPELPVINQRHRYKVAGKYSYCCVNCDNCINRQTKSINTKRKFCGVCGGQLELFINKKIPGQTEVPEFELIPVSQKPNTFALFVKENYKTVKDAHNGKKHGEIMKILGQQYAISKSVASPDPI